MGERIALDGYRVEEYMIEPGKGLRGLLKLPTLVRTSVHGGGMTKEEAISLRRELDENAQVNVKFKVKKECVLDYI